VAAAVGTNLDGLQIVLDAVSNSHAFRRLVYVWSDLAGALVLALTADAAVGRPTDDHPSDGYNPDPWCGA
jgi:hypothetical protein